MLLLLLLLATPARTDDLTDATYNCAGKQISVHQQCDGCDYQAVS